jgi:hypothetical protein
MFSMAALPSDCNAGSYTSAKLSAWQKLYKLKRERLSHAQKEQGESAEGQVKTKGK